MNPFFVSEQEINDELFEAVALYEPEIKIPFIASEINRDRTVKEAFLISAIANEIVFANRYMTVNNFENEWELVDGGANS